MTRGVSDPEKLSTEQKRALVKAEKAQAKMTEVSKRYEAAVRQRDEAVSVALDQGVAQALLARTLKLSAPMVWKIRDTWEKSR